MTRTRHQLRALAGVGGPAAFIVAWVTLGATRAGYSPIHDPISRLAAIGAPGRLAMTGGFLAFGLGASLYATELVEPMGVGAATAAATTAVATVGIAATPLGSALGNRPHAAFAGVAYASLAAMPILAGRTLNRRGRKAGATASVALGLASGVCLLASALEPQRVGLWQRAGLTLGDAWIIATSLQIARNRRRAARGR